MASSMLEPWTLPARCMRWTRTPVQTLWTFASGGSVNSGAAIVDGAVYWGSGYGVRGIGLKPNNKLYAFVPREDCWRPGSCTGTAGQGGAGGMAGTGGAAGAGGVAGGGSGGPIPSTWTGIYSAYLGPSTIGHCSGCHNGSGRIRPLNSASLAYDSLVAVGQIDGTSSPIGKRGLSRLSWFGGDMPPNGSDSRSRCRAGDRRVGRSRRTQQLTHAPSCQLDRVSITPAP